ncbi:hypothetical protein [Caulobacter sp. DWR1-3-2b1]|uniref:hypothetical protein n=1 Tax=Caulobacter sp. DWR1-3-2b1 TaxID=2804670 RepID=UPI003CFA3A28
MKGPQTAAQKAAKILAKDIATQALLKRANAAAASLGATTVTLGLVSGKAYEAWVMLEIATAFRTHPSHPVRVEVCDNIGGKTATLRIGDGPRPMSGTTFNADAAGFLRIHAPTPMELHNSLLHRGRSGETHELDVALIDAAKAKALRASGGGAFFEKPELGMELKDYAPPSSLSKNIARALLGVAVDLKGIYYRAGPPFHGRWPGRFALATPTGLSKPTRNMLDKVNITPMTGLTPTGAGNRFERIARKWLG